MTKYLLFIDTEASGLPKKWNVPYSSGDNWPHIAQIAWIVYTGNGVEVKRENHFISDSDFEISDSAKNIHGITREFLNKNGESRKEVLTLLTNHLDRYNPLVIGHFMELDFHMVGADANRIGVENPLAKCTSFCTMLATTHLVQNPAKKYLNLCELHAQLFNNALINHHNAIEDAQATARCFFELLKRGEIDEEKIEKQQKFLKEPQGKPVGGGCSFVVVLFIIVVTLIIIL